MAKEKLILSDSQEPIMVGDTYKGFNFVYDIDGTAVNLTDATIRMKLVSDTGGTIEKSSTDGGFTITSATTGAFKLNEINRMDYPAGTYNGDLEITTNDTRRFTPILVQLLLLDDTTK